MTKLRRGWNGKLNGVGDLLSWMYDKGMLTRTEKNQKDTIFYRYYRYYNDGDKPRGYAYASEPAIEKYLEESVEVFIRAMIKKYAKKVNRRDFYLERAGARLRLTGAPHALPGKIPGMLKVYAAEQYIEKRNVESAKQKLERLKELQAEMAKLEVEIARDIKRDFAESKFGSQILKDLDSYDYKYTYGYIDEAAAA